MSPDQKIHWAPIISNQFMDEQASATRSQIVVYLIVEYTPQRSISAAVFDDRRRTFHITSFTDNEHYTNLESMLIQTNPQEQENNFSVHISIKTEIKSEIMKVMNRLENIQCTVDTSKAANYDLNLALQNLLAKDLVLYRKSTEDKKAMVALQRLLSILKLDQDKTNQKQFELGTFSFDSFMKLDQPVINALQIFPKDMERKIISGTNTIFEILNKCKTPIGTRCLKRWMRQPLQNADEINERLDKVGFFIKHSNIKNAIQNELRKLPDLDNLYYVFYKVDSGKKNSVEVNDLIKIYRTVHTMKQLLQSLTDKGTIHEQIRNTITQIEQNVKILNTICKMIQDNIIMEGRDNEFYVKPEAQKDLTVINKEQMKINKQIKEHTSEVQGYLKIDIQMLPSSVYKYVFEADKKRAIDLIKENSDYKYLTSKQNKITFTTETLSSYCKQLLTLEQEYKEKEKQILVKMYKVVAGYFPIMEQLSKVLSQLDVLTSFATVVNASAGSDTPWCRPSFKQYIRGSKIHHPCVKTCVPNDCDISTSKTIILTGPNMGGKSTYIRTVGLATYLAHIGCYVPAKEFETSIVDAIITRVGASDMQIKGISTFMSEMIESVTMIDSATEKSLVLIDQLGRGTSTSEGFGIAWAICNQLHTKIKPFCLFATHFHEMTRMADQLEGVCNMYTSCKIIDNKLQLEYKVYPGKIEKSYGVEVARMLKFPEKILKSAESYLQLYESTSNQATSAHAGGHTTAQEIQGLRLYNQMNNKLSGCSEGQQKAIKQQYRKEIRQILGGSA